MPPTALSNVDLPEPFVPMTMTKEPLSMVRLRSRSACTSLSVPGLNDFLTPRISSIRPTRLPSLDRFQRAWEDESYEDKGCGYQLQIVWVEPQPQANCHQQTEKHGPHDGSDYGHSCLRRSHQRLADYHTGESPNDHANSHLYVGETLILGQERAR